MIDHIEFYKQIQLYPDCRQAFQLQYQFKNEAAFEKLISLRDCIPSELYGACLRYLYIADTNGVNLETLLTAFHNIDKQDIMEDTELEKYKSFQDKITIFRGTDDDKEETPRLSWSLSLKVAKRFATVHLFKSVISKKEVIAYFNNTSYEEEIIALVGDDFEKLY